MKLLIVEDQTKTGQYLCQGLSEAGFATELATDGNTGQHLALTGDYDLLILDVMLPGRDGWQILQAVRAAGLDIPVLFLTARDAVEDRVHGLELGADDYLGKPFSPRELQARIKALLRRAGFGQERNGGDVLTFDDWRLDTVSHRLFHRDGEEVILSGADFALLKLFLDHPQQILDRDTIGNATRGREPMPLDRIVDMAVSRLRQRLRDTQKPPRLIRTVRGSGYLLAASVAPAH